MPLSRTDRLFFMSLFPSVIVVTGLLLVFLLVVSTQSFEAVKTFGPRLFTSSSWDPEREVYGILSPIVGTVVVASIATCLALILSIPLSILVIEYLKGKARDALTSLIELMGGVPTIIYATWAVYYLAPLVKTAISEPLHEYLGFVPIFSCKPITGFSILAAGIALGISLVPYMASLITEAYKLVPLMYREACLGIGATRYETAKTMLGIIKPAILASAMLGFARASGETTIAVTTIGNAMSTGYCVLGPGYTIPALIASQYANANLYRYAESVLYAAALVILVLNLALSFVGLWVLGKWRVRIVV